MGCCLITSYCPQCQLLQLSCSHRQGLSHLLCLLLQRSPSHCQGLTHLLLLSMLRRPAHCRHAIPNTMAFSLLPALPALICARRHRCRCRSKHRWHWLLQLICNLELSCRIRYRRLRLLQYSNTTVQLYNSTYCIRLSSVRQALAALLPHAHQSSRCCPLPPTSSAYPPAVLHHRQYILITSLWTAWPECPTWPRRRSATGLWLRRR